MESAIMGFYYSYNSLFLFYLDVEHWLDFHLQKHPNNVVLHQTQLTHDIAINKNQMGVSFYLYNPQIVFLE